ncbi:MAG: flagellar export chaperone FliS [Pseudomonadota bacterium]
MYATVSNGTREYRNAKAEHVIDTADGYTLVQSLMTRLIARVAMAKHCIKNDDVPAKGEHLAGAVEIVNVLQVAVDDTHNADLAGNLVALYDYMARQLVTANLKNDVTILDEVEGLVRELKQAWDAVGTDPAARSAAATP